MKGTMKASTLRNILNASIEESYDGPVIVRFLWQETPGSTPVEGQCWLRGVEMREIVNSEGIIAHDFYLTAYSTLPRPDTKDEVVNQALPYLVSTTDWHVIEGSIVPDESPESGTGNDRDTTG